MKLVNTVTKKLDTYQQKHHFTGFIYAVIKKYGEDHAGYQAALLTYYGFLSLFPLLMVLTTLTDMFAGNRPELEEAVVKAISDYFPVLGDQLSSHIHSLAGNGPALLIGILFTLYGARGVADVLQNGVQKVWGIDPPKRPGFPLNILKSIGIMVVGGLGFIAVAIISGVAASAGHGLLVVIVSYLVNLFLLFWVYAAIINVCLPKEISLKDIRLGAAVAALGLLILQAIGGYILTRQLKDLNALYSYFAVTLGLLFWIYLQAQMFYYSAVTSVVSTKRLWPRSFNDQNLNN